MTENKEKNYSYSHSRVPHTKNQLNYFSFHVSCNRRNFIDETATILEPSWIFSIAHKDVVVLEQRTWQVPSLAIFLFFLYRVMTCLLNNINSS